MFQLSRFLCDPPAPLIARSPRHQAILATRPLSIHADVEPAVRDIRGIVFAQLIESMCVPAGHALTSHLTNDRL